MTYNGWYAIKPNETLLMDGKSGMYDDKSQILKIRITAFMPSLRIPNNDTDEH